VNSDQDDKALRKNCHQRRLTAGGGRKEKADKRPEKERKGGKRKKELSEGTIQNQIQEKIPKGHRPCGTY